jgi:hypothetical protein
MWIRTLACVFLLSLVASAQTTTISPDTSLTAETGNNTSAADSFPGQPNGNTGNVSKAPTRTLLYEEADTKLYVHFQPWFGEANHIDVGYRSDDAEQVRRQVADMMSRGFDGAVSNWYGPHMLLENEGTFLLMREAELHSGFEFGLLYDVGALHRCARTDGCDVTQELIDHLHYADQTFLQSPAYMRHDGRPVISFFGMMQYPIDWERVRQETRGDVHFLFRYVNSTHTGFNHPGSDGGFSWLRLGGGPQTALAYLDEFYTTALAQAPRPADGSAFKGFDDTLSPWRTWPARQMDQECGQTWLASMAQAGQHYSSSNQLPSLSVVTWNDYEEGTQIETGIDNCVSVSANVSGHSVSWSLSGEQNTVHSFRLFISADGENLMSLGDAAAGARSFDLEPFGFQPEEYQVFVQAVGRPSLTNRMSAAARYKAQYVVIAQPEEGARVTAPVRIVAEALSPVAVTRMDVLANNKLIHSVSGSTLDADVNPGNGNRTLTVRALDAEGTSFESSVQVRVSPR